jgi:hypothetical protein
MALFAGDDNEREMVAAQLQHPGILFGGLAENGNVIELFTEDRIVASVDLEDFVALHNLLNLFKR